MAVSATLALAAPAQAGFPGGNGKLVFQDPLQGKLFTVNPDGSGRAPLTANLPGSEIDPRWSPDGRTVAYSADRGDGNYDIYTLATGTGVETRLTTNPAIDREPAWTPDGARIVFTSGTGFAYDLWAMNADGTGLTQLTSGPARDISPAVSPDGTKVAFASTRDHPSNLDVYVMDIDGADITRVPISDAPDCWIDPEHFEPDWSPSGERLVFAWTAAIDCGQELDSVPGRIETIRPDGTGQILLREDPNESLGSPAWSPDGTRIAFSGVSEQVFSIDSDDGGNLATVTAGQAPDWQPLLQALVRPKGATPLRVALVPAYQPCAAPNREHGPPLAYPSCAPPVPGSTRLTVGVGDGSPALARSVGSLRLATIIGQPGPPNDSDVKLRVVITNVMNASDRSEYTGELRARFGLRITDRDNQPAPTNTAPGWGSGTVVDTTFAFSFPCAPTPDSSLDASTCSINTTANAVTPGVIKDGKRTMWQLQQVEVYDGGADGDGDTEGDNELFEVQGIFVP